MYYLIGFVLGCVLIKAYRDYRRKPNGTLIAYVIVLAMDLVVGCSIIFWKCSISKSEEECELAVGGTVGSVIIWLLIMLLCPCFAACVEICITLDNLKKKCIRYMDKIRTRNSRDTVIQNEAHIPTTTPMLENGSPVDQRSKDFVFNEKRGARDQSIKLHETDRTRDHIPIYQEARNNTPFINYLQPDVP